MKKFSKILIFALSLVIALSAFAIASSANTSPFLVEGLYRESWEEAIENAYIKGDRIVPVELLTDYEANGESVEITESVVVSLNGHTLKSAAGAPLFSVSGKDTTLTIMGPGTILCEGTLFEVQSGNLVLDASRGLSIVSEGSESVAVLGGEAKASASVTSNVSFESNGASLFELGSGSEFKLATGGAITAKPSATANAPFAIAVVNSGAKVNVLGGSLANSGGYIFKVGDDTEAEAPVSISCESAVLVSDSANYGSIVEAGSAYANVDIRYSEVVASGGAFSADDTLLNFEGEGRDKVYAKPTVRVNFVSSTYEVSESNTNANASLFFGNVTGIVIASEIWISETTEIAINTRLWDGECGVLLKKGVKVSATSTTIASDNEAPLTDEDGTTVYFNPTGNTNNNFSLETINGVPCKLYRSTNITADSDLVDCLVVTDEISYFADITYSSNFNNSNPTANAITSSYGAITVETMKDADGKDNRFFKWEYDAAKKDQYFFASGNSFFELDAGGSNGATRGFDALVNNEFITWDFDITTSNGTYSYAGLKMFIREKAANYAYTDNFATITGNTFKLQGMNTGYPLSTVPYEWTHITLVLEIDSSGAYSDGTTTFYPNLGNSMIHFYANGEYCASTKIFNANVSSAEGIKKGGEFSLDAIRFGLNGGAAVNKDISTSLLLDNTMITYYPKGYEGGVSESDKDDFILNSNDYSSYKKECQSTGAPITKTIQDFVGNIEVTLKDALINKSAFNLKELYDVVYKKGYRMPGVGVVDTDDRTPLVVVDNVKYYDVDEALRAITDNSVVYLYTDVETEFNVNSSFTVYTKHADGKEYKFNVLSDSYYISELRENGEVVGYKTLLANTFITIYWQVNTGYQTQVPLGIVPKYDWIVPSPYYDAQGRSIELLGWSSDENATTPEEIGAITKDDLIKGYKVYYPVMGPSKVPVSFLDAQGNPIMDSDGKPVVKEISVGTPESELNKYFNGSSLPTLQIDGNNWYEKSFSAWSIPNGVVGDQPLFATPKFDKVSIKASAIKTSFTIVRLVDFTPSLYILKPDANALPADEAAKIQFSGFSLDGNNLLQGSGDWSNQYVYDNVKIGDDVYYKLNFARSINYGKPGSALLEDFEVYVHYTYDGVSKVESVNISISSYLEAALAAADNDKEKSAILEIMRLIKNYLELAENTNVNVYSVCSKYVNDSQYAEYLSDYTTAIKSVSQAKLDANKTMLDNLYQHAERNIRWNFVNNSISFTPVKSLYPKLSNSWTVTTESSDGIMIKAVTAKTNARMGNGFNAQTGTYSFTLSFGSNSNYGTSMVTAYDTSTENKAADMIEFQYCNYYLIDGRKVLHSQYYNLTAHITELTARKSAGEAGLDSELKMAQIILATQLALAECTAESGADIIGAINPPVAALPKR